MTDKIIRRGDAALLASGSPPVRNLIQSQQEHMDMVFHEAYDAGFQAGHDAGLQGLVTATAEAVEAVRHQFFNLEPMLAPLVLQAVQKIIGAMPPGEVVRRAITEALSESGGGLAATLRVAPDDLDDTRAAVTELLATRSDLARCLAGVEADAGLRKGEMLLETLKGRTHIGIAYQMARLHSAVAGSAG